MSIPNGDWVIIMHKLFFRRSLKLRLFLIIFTVGIIPGILLCQALVQSYESRAVKIRTSDVQNQLTIISKHLTAVDYFHDTSSEAINSELELLSNLYDGRVVVINNNLRVIKDTYSLAEGKTFVSEEVIRCLNGENIANFDAINGFVEIAIPIENAGVLLTSVSTDQISTTAVVLRQRYVILILIGAIIIFAIAYFFSKRLVKPFDIVSTELQELGNLDRYEPISVPDYIETEHLALGFNTLINRMSSIDASRQEFVSNVSHELKTPLTSMKILADSLISQPDAPVELYREFMTDIASEIEREDRIINDLLTLVKLDKEVAELNRTQVCINDLTEIILKRLRPIARKNDVELTLISQREVVAGVDEVKLSLAITNLVENAIKYNRPQGTVTVTVDADHQFFTIVVEDTGIGIPTEELDEIYERFYRVDKSHSRAIGGTGLGLSIAKYSISLHKGTLSAESTVDVGSKFTIRIPL